MGAPLPAALAAVASREPIDLVDAALVIARLEYPRLDETPARREIDRLGRIAHDRLGRLAGPAVRPRIDALNALLFEETGFAGNRAHYDDFRNSCLNDVLARRLGIPITLALVYMEVGRRAGLRVDGVAFPGHFLMLAPGGAPGEPDLLLDPFDGGAELDDLACRRLLARHLGEEAPLDPLFRRPCTPRQMVARMLNNLKRTYVEMRSFPQARAVTELLLTLDPTLHSERRDRGLLAYHLDDFPAALRDLEDYLRLLVRPDALDTEERDQVQEHIRALRRRVAGLN